MNIEELITYLKTKERWTITLCGSPLSGKSTLVNKLKSIYELEFDILSLDLLRIEYGELESKQLEKIYLNIQRDIILKNTNVIFDNLNLRKKRRHRQVRNMKSLVPKGHEYIPSFNVCIWMNKYHNAKTYKKLNDKRAKDTGKYIPRESYLRIISEIEYPTIENFDLIVKI